MLACGPKSPFNNIGAGHMPLVVFHIALVFALVWAGKTACSVVPLAAAIVRLVEVACLVLVTLGGLLMSSECLEYSADPPSCK